MVKRVSPPYTKETPFSPFPFPINLILPRHDHAALCLILLIDDTSALALAQQRLALLLSLHNRAAQTAGGLDEVADAGAGEVVLFADLGGLDGLEEEGGADAGGEVEEEALGRVSWGLGRGVGWDVGR